jgi:hypothetical protein
MSSTEDFLFSHSQASNPAEENYQQVLLRTIFSLNNVIVVNDEIVGVLPSLALPQIDGGELLMFFERSFQKTLAALSQQEH